jgi:hypothetical protein
MTKPKHKARRKSEGVIIPKGKYRLEYSANNSGGNWWLRDKDWHALERAGWTIEWVDGSKSKSSWDSPDKPTFLGAPATEAWIITADPDQSIRDWAEITNQDPWEEGCNCCGHPHCFSYEDAAGHTKYARVETSTSFRGWD